MSWKKYLPAAKSIEYIGWPREFGPSEYAAAASEAARLVEASAPGASVYQLGGVRAPGISDLDFAIVLSEANQDPVFRHWPESVRALPRSVAYMLDEKPLVLTPALWSELPILQEPITSTHIGGPALPAPSPLEGSVAANLGLFASVERLLFSTNPELRSLFQGQIHVRRTLKRLAKVRLQAGVLAQFGISRPHWTDFIGRVVRLRDEWFSLPRVRQRSAVYDLFIAMPEIEYEVTAEASGILGDQGVAFPESPQHREGILAALDQTALFLRDYLPELSLEYAGRSLKATGRIVSILPANFILLPLIYAHCSTSLAAMLEKDIRVFGPLPELGQFTSLPGVMEKVNALEQYARFVENHHYRWARKLPLSMWYLLRSYDRRRTPFAQDPPDRLASEDDFLPSVFRSQLGRSRPRLANHVPPSVLPLLMTVRRLAAFILPGRSRRGRIARRAIAWLRNPLGRSRNES